MKELRSYKCSHCNDNGGMATFQFEGQPMVCPECLKKGECCMCHGDGEVLAEEAPIVRPLFN